jgi:Na+/proline symporter
MNSLFYMLILIIYFAVFIGIGLYLTKSAKEYKIFGQAQGRFGFLGIMLLSVGAMIGGGGLIGLSTATYNNGLEYYWTYAMAYLGGIPWLILFVKRVKIVNVMTAPDLFELRFPKYKGFIRYPSGVLYMVRGCTLLAMQFNALAFMFTAFFNWPHWAGVVFSAAVVVVYTVAAGYLSVAITNQIQSIFQTLAPIVALIFVLWAVHGYSNVIADYEAIGEASKASLTGDMGGGFFKHFFYEFFTVSLWYWIGDQYNFQRIGASKNFKIARSAMLWGIIIAIPSLLIPSYIGVSAISFLPEGFDPSLLFYLIIKQTSPAIAVLLLVGALSTIMSATSSYMFETAMNTAHDLLIHHFRVKGKMPADKVLIKYSRIGVAIAALIGILLSIFVPGIMAVWLAGLALCTGGMFVPWFGMWFSKRINTEGAIASMFTGGISCFVWWQVLGNPYGFHGTWLGIIVSIVTVAICAAVFPKPDQENIDKTYYFSERFKVSDESLINK